MNFFNDSNIAPKSIKTYNYCLNRWLSLIPPPHNISYLVTDHNNSITLLHKHLSDKGTCTPTNLHIHYTAIINAINLSPSYFSSIPNETVLSIRDKYKQLRHENSAEINQRRISNKPTEIQLQKAGTYLKYSDIVAKRDSLEDGDINKLLLGFYTHIPPVRADYFATEIINIGETPQEPNYITICDKQTSKLVITDFKTKQRYGSIEHTLPPLLHRQLFISLHKHPRRYLFVNRYDKPFTRPAFSQWAHERLTTLFQKELTLTIIRHLFVSTLDFNMSADKLKMIGDKMGHSLGLQKTYQWNFESDSESED
jgi:hypothetical protein